MAHAFNLTTWEAEAGNLYEFKASLAMFQDSQGYIVISCLIKINKQNEWKNMGKIRKHCIK